MSRSNSDHALGRSISEGRSSEFGDRNSGELEECTSGKCEPEQFESQISSEDWSLDERLRSIWRIECERFTLDPTDMIDSEKMEDQMNG